MAQIHGMLGSLKAGGVEIGVTEWSGDHKNDVKEGTTTKNNGFRTWVKGLESMGGSFKAIWDTSENPYILTISPGTFVDMEMHVTDTSFYSFEGVVMNVNVTSPVQDLVVYSCNYESNGAVVAPS